MYAIPTNFESIDVKNGWKDAKIVIQEKRLGNIWKTDIRIWAKNKESDEYFPTKKGITLENTDWNDYVLPLLKSMLEKYQ